MDREQTLWLLTATAAILIAEVIAGRHRQLYKRRDHLVNGLTLLIGMAFTRPLVAVIIAGGIGLLSPANRGMFAETSFAVALLMIVLVGEFFATGSIAWRIKPRDLGASRGFGSSTARIIPANS